MLFWTRNSLLRLVVLLLLTQSLTGASCLADTEPDSLVSVAGISDASQDNLARSTNAAMSNNAATSNSPATSNNAASSKSDATKSADASPLIRLVATDDATTKLQIDNLTKKILREEIHLERFNIHYRIEVAKQGRLKSLRYFLSQQTNATSTFAGLVGTVQIRTSHFHHSDKLMSAPLERATVPAIPGQIIGASGSALEFLINEYHRWQSNRLGFSPKAAKASVLQSRNKIDSLMAERDALVSLERSSPTLSPHYSIDSQEGVVLKDIRDMTLHEFVAYHVGQRRYLAFQQCLYIFDIMKNSTGAVGSFLAYEANHEHRRRFNLASGVFSLISGGLVMGTPVISRIYGKVIAEREHRFVKAVEDESTPDQAKLGADVEVLHKLCATYGQTTAKRTAGRFVLYQDDKKDLDEELRQSARELRAGRLAATETISTGLFAGATKVALNVDYIIDGNSYFKNVRVTNYLLGSASIGYLTGASVAMLDNLRIQIQSEFVNAKLRRQHLLPSQLLQARLKDLDEMEAVLGPPTN